MLKMLLRIQKYGFYWDDGGEKPGDGRPKKARSTKKKGFHLDSGLLVYGYWSMDVKKTEDRAFNISFV